MNQDLSTEKSMKLVVVTEIISPYRVPVFNCMARVLGPCFKVFFMAEICPGRAWKVPYSKIEFDYEVLPGVNFNQNARKPNPLYWNPGVGKALGTFSPDIIVIGGYHHFTSLLVRKYARRRSSRLILWCESTLHDGRSRNPILEGFKKRFIHSCDGYLVPGKASEEYLRFYGVRGPIFCAPNVVDVEMFRSQGAPIEEKREEEKSKFRRLFQLPGFNLLYVGRLSPEKGLPTLFQAVENIQKRGIELGLVLVGDGPCRKEYEREVRRLGLKHVLFLGFKHEEGLPYYYSTADLLVLPSHSEPWGLVVNESLACGLPVLCSKKVGCSDDLIIEGKTGFLCTEAKDYEEKIVALMAKSDYLVRMREYCYEHIAQFTPERCADGFLSLCQFEFHQPVTSYI